MEKAKTNTLSGVTVKDNYARTHIPQNRWADTWDLLKTCFVKLVIINVFTFLFCFPAVILIIFANQHVANLGNIYPFFSNVGLGVFSYPDVIGMAESIRLNVDLFAYALLIAAGFIAAVGIAGGAYSIRKLILTHGDFTLKGFFYGVKTCYFATAIPLTLFLVFFYATIAISDWADLVIAQGQSAGGPITAKVFIIIATVLVGIVCMWLLAVGTSYKSTPKQYFGNTFKLMIGSIIPTIFMVGFSLLPAWLFWIGTLNQIVAIISYAVFFFIGFSFILLCWLSYTQWVFDNWVTPEIAKQKLAEIGKKPTEDTSEQAIVQQNLAMELLAAGKSELIGRPIMPIAEQQTVKPVGSVFSRADLQRVSAERAQLQNDLISYTTEHQSEEKYVKYNKMFAEREKALQSNGKKGKKKKVSSKNLLR